MTGIVIQARKGSTRLPNKMVLPFYKNQGVLDIVINKIKQKYQDNFIILATTNNNIDDELVEIAKKNNIKYYRGDEENVLSRFIEVGEKYKLKNIIRVCADNPFLDVNHIQVLIDQIELGNSDYISYKNENSTPIIKTHLGLFTEAVTLKALKTVPNLTSNKVYYEHVTNYIYSHKYKIDLLDLPKFFKKTDSIRLTLDTKEDFNLEKILYTKTKDFSTKELIRFILNDNLLLTNMKQEILKNTK